MGGSASNKGDVKTGGGQRGGWIMGKARIQKIKEMTEKARIWTLTREEAAREGKTKEWEAIMAETRPRP